MNKFVTYRQSGKFRLTIQNICLLSIITSSFIFFVARDLETPLFINISGVSVALSFLLYFILAVTSIGRNETLHGEFGGLLILEYDRIIIEEDVYLLNDIKKIEISNDDIKGQLRGGSWTANGKISHGIRNHIKLWLDNKTIQRGFQQDNSNQILHNVELLLEYNKKGKLSQEELANILGYVPNTTANTR